MRFLASCIGLSLIAGVAVAQPRTSPPPKAAPVKVIFDTDVGNDVDDVLAHAMLHSLQSRGQVELLAVTITNPNPLAGPFADALNHFYGRPEIPVGCTRKKLDPAPSRFLKLAEAVDDGKPRYPHKLKSGSDAPEATALIRQILSKQPDNSVALVQVGYFSNFADLLDTKGDEHSPLTGVELIKQKVKVLSIMAGSFQTIDHNNHYLEFNVVKDIPAAQKLAKEWPSPIVWSGFEIGIAAAYPHVSIERDFGYVPHHIAAEAYYLYEPPPHDRPTWDLTSVLYASFSDRGYFDLSRPGGVTVENDGFTRFAPKKDGRDRFLIMSPTQAARVKEALVQLSSQPPGK